MSAVTHTRVTSVSRSRGKPLGPARVCLEKSPQSEGVRPWNRVAEALLRHRVMARLLLGSLSVLTWGCLVPQDDSPLPPDPIFLNRAPYFVNTSPSASFIPTDNCEGTSLEFRVNVADPDTDDRVGIRYYVDFPDINVAHEWEVVASNANNSEVRPNTVIWAPVIQSPSSPLSAPGLHTVEAVVFDGTLSPERVPEPRAVIPDAGVNPSYAAIHRWVVETEECP